MNDKYYVAEKNKGRVWTVLSDPFMCCGTLVVKLEGKSSVYAADGLDLVNMSDLIERNALLDTLPKNDVVLSFDVRRIVADMPAVGAVPVVRCECCVYGEQYKRMDGENGYYCKHPENAFEYWQNQKKFTPTKEKNDFCSFGKERKDAE